MRSEKWGVMDGSGGSEEWGWLQDSEGGVCFSFAIRPII